MIWEVDKNLVKVKQDYKIYEKKMEMKIYKSTIQHSGDGKKN